MLQVFREGVGRSFDFALRVDVIFSEQIKTECLIGGVCFYGSP